MPAKAGKVLPVASSPVPLASCRCSLPRRGATSAPVLQRRKQKKLSSPLLPCCPAARASLRFLGVGWGACLAFSLRCPSLAGRATRRAGFCCRPPPLRGVGRQHAPFLGAVPLGVALRDSPRAFFQVFGRLAGLLFRFFALLCGFSRLPSQCNTLSRVKASPAPNGAPLTGGVPAGVRARKSTAERKYST